MYTLAGIKDWSKDQRRKEPIRKFMIYDSSNLGNWNVTYITELWKAFGLTAFYLSNIKILLTNAPFSLHKYTRREIVELYK